MHVTRRDRSGRPSSRSAGPVGASAWAAVSRRGAATARAHRGRTAPGVRGTVGPPRPAAGALRRPVGVRRRRCLASSATCRLARLAAAGRSSAFAVPRACPSVPCTTSPGSRRADAAPRSTSRCPASTASVRQRERACAGDGRRSTTCDDEVEPAARSVADRASPARRLVPARADPAAPSPRPGGVPERVREPSRRRLGDVTAYLDHAATTPMLPAALEALTEQSARVGNASSLHTSGRAARARRRGVARAHRRRARRPAVRGRLHLRGHRVRQPRRQGRLARPPARRPGPGRLLVTSGIEHHAVLDRVEYLAVAREGARSPGSSPTACGHIGRRQPPRGAGARRRGRGERHVGQQRGRHGAAGRGARRRRARARRPVPHRRRAGRRPPAGRLRRERRRPDDGERAQDRWPDRRRRAPGPPRRPARPDRPRWRAGAAGAQRHPRRAGIHSASPSRSRRPSSMRDVEAKRLMVLRDRLIEGALALGLGIAVTGCWTARRRDPAAARQRPPARARVRRRLAALPARRRRRRVLDRVGLPGRRAAAEPRAARDGRPRGARRAARCGSPLGHTSTEADVDAFLAALPGRRRACPTGGRPALMRVVAAMSGGVDSAVAAARMLDAGHEVVGVHLALSRPAATLRESARGCCTIEDAGDARRVADVLGIPFYVWDLASRFERDVVEDFVAEYAAGRTPNPCLRCNERIKFAGAARQGRGAGLRRRGDRALRAGRRGGRRAPRAAPGRRLRPRTSPTCSGCSTTTSSPARSSRSATRPSPQVREEAAERGLLRRAASPTATTSASSPTATPAAGSTRRLGERPGELVDAASGRWSGTHAGRVRVHRRPASRARARPVGARRPSRATSWRSTPATNRGRHRHGRPARRRRSSRATTRAGAVRPRRARCASEPRCGRTVRRCRRPPGAADDGSACACGSTTGSAASRPASRSCSTRGPGSSGRRPSAAPDPPDPGVRSASGDGPGSRARSFGRHAAIAACDPKSCVPGAAQSSSRLVSWGAVRSPPASPVLTTPVGSMSTERGLLGGDRAVLDASRHDEQLARPEGDLAVGQPDGQGALDHEEELVGVGVGVPHELALDLDDLDLVVVQGRDDLGGPVVREEGEPVLEVDDACHGPTLRGGPRHPGGLGTARGHGIRLRTGTFTFAGQPLWCEGEGSGIGGKVGTPRGMIEWSTTVGRGASRTGGWTSRRS